MGLFASWGWNRGDPTNVKYKAVTCPERLTEHIGAQFGPNGAEGGGEGPTPAPTLAPTPSPTPGLCKPWCSTDSKLFFQKCQWGNCAGCSEYQVNSGQCKAWCATTTKNGQRNVRGRNAVVVLVAQMVHGACVAAKALVSLCQMTNYSFEGMHVVMRFLN